MAKGPEKTPLKLCQELERVAAMHPNFFFSLQLLEACAMIRKLAKLPPQGATRRAVSN
jgi:hypothetical protein